jgi:hypothetical protein
MVLAMLATATCSRSDPDERVIGACNSSPEIEVNRDTARYIVDQSKMIVEQARALKSDVADSADSFGFIGMLKRQVPGSHAKDLANRIALLRFAIANAKAYEMAWATGGKSPLPAHAPWACQVLANSIATFSTENSQQHVIESLQVVEDHFARIAKSGAKYAGSG